MFYLFFFHDKKERKNLDKTIPQPGVLSGQRATLPNRQAQYESVNIKKGLI
jgi:hypothetical protein